MEEENTNSQRTDVQIKYKQKQMYRSRAGSHNALLRLKTETRVNETEKSSGAFLEHRVMRATLQMTRAQPSSAFTLNNNEKATQWNLQSRCMYIFLHR